MPVLEWAVPAAAGVFLPLLLWVHYARAAMRLVSSVASRLSLSGFGPVDSLINAATSDPDEIAAVLHGVLLGPIAPTIEQRRSITAPTLVLGHGIDLIHSFSDARNLARQLPDARLIRTRTFAELWVRPARLTAEIAGFLDRVWAGAQTPADPSADHVVGPAGAPGTRSKLNPRHRARLTPSASRYQLVRDGRGVGREIRVPVRRALVCRAAACRPMRRTHLGKHRRPWADAVRVRRVRARWPSAPLAVCAWRLPGAR
jgi:hypothetical protein